MDKELLHGYALADGRYWFSIAFRTSEVDPNYRDLVASGYLEPYPIGSPDLPSYKGSYWQRDYAFTEKGFARIKQLQTESEST